MIKHPIQVALGVFLMTMFLIAMIEGQRDISDLTNVPLPFTPRWYGAFLLLSATTALTTFLVLR